MRTKREVSVISVFIFVCSVLLNCSISSSQANDSGFKVVITGAYEGKVSGVGVLQLLPQGGFRKQGYFFLADGRGLRPHGVTFVLPLGIGVGKHPLSNPSPLDSGTVPSVRVDRDTGTAVVSSERNTAGFVELTSFPADENKLSGASVAGRFENLRFHVVSPPGYR